MNTSRPSGGWRINRDSFSVMVVWFKDGNTRTFYSIDWKSRNSASKNKETGINRFKKKIIEYGSKANGILIAENDSPVAAKRTPIAFYYEGVQCEIPGHLNKIQNN